MSLQTITEINLDINQPGISVVHAKQYDTVRQVKAHLFYNGVKWLVPSNNYLAVVAYKKADRIGGFYDETEDGETSVTVDGTDRSIIYISLDRQVLTTAGNVNTEVTFYDSVTSGRLSTFSFIVQVEPASLDELDLSSNPYFNILAADISAVLEAEANISGLTASGSKIAPGATPTVTVTGGTEHNPYNLAFGIPTFAGMTASATGLAAGASPTATVSGGTSGTTKYNIAFGIPKGDKGDAPTPTGTAYAYQNSTSGTTIPSGSWSNTPNPEKGKYTWVRATTTWNNNQTTVAYAVGYSGVDGTGAVHSVNGQTGTVVLTADDIETDVSGITVQDVLDGKDLILQISSVNTLPRTFTNALITADHVISQATLSNPAAQTSDWTVNTANNGTTGTVTISGSISGTTDVTLVLTKPTTITDQT